MFNSYHSRQEAATVYSTRIIVIITFLCLHMQSHGIGQDFFVLVCYKASSPNFFWQIFIFAYLVVLQIIGIILSFQTRKVKVQGLSDSKYIATIIYISSIVIVVLALVTFSLRTYINIGTGIVVAGIFILTTIFLALVFLPKVLSYYTCSISIAIIPYSGKFSREKTFTNFADLMPFEKVFSTKMGVAHFA